MSVKSSNHIQKLKVKMCPSTEGVNGQNKRENKTNHAKKLMVIMCPSTEEVNGQRNRGNKIIISFGLWIY